MYVFSDKFVSAKKNNNKKTTQQTQQQPVLKESWKDSALAQLAQLARVPWKRKDSALPE